MLCSMGTLAWGGGTALTSSSNVALNGAAMTPTSVAINSDPAITHTPDMAITLGTVTPTAVGTSSFQFTPRAAVTLTRLEWNLTTQAAGCTTSPVITAMVTCTPVRIAFPPNGICLQSQGIMVLLTPAQIDEFKQNIEVFSAVSDWISGYLVRPHKELGRSGPVCPYTPAALVRDTLRITVVRFIGSDSRTGNSSRGSALQRRVS